MTATLIRISPLLRGMLKPMALALGGVNLLLGLLGFAAGRGEDVLPWVAVALWLPAAVFMIWVTWGGRELRWELTIPVKPHVLWRAQGVAVLLSTLAIWSAGVLTVALLEFLAHRLGGRWISSIEALVATLVASICGTIAVAAWAQGRHRDLRTIDAPVLGRWADIVMIVVLAAVVFAVARTPVIAASTLLGASFLMVLWSSRRIPGAWLASCEQESREVTPTDVGELGSARWGRSLDLRVMFMIVRSTSRGLIQVVTVYPLVLLFGAFLGGLGAVLLPGSELRLLFLPVTAYLLVAGVVFPLSGVKAVDALPLSRGRVFSALVLPLWACLLLGYGAGAILHDGFAGRGEQFAFVDEEDRYGLLVPFSLFELVRDGTPPSQTTDEGQPFEPLAVPLLEDDGPVLWKPYTTPRGCSPLFAGLQLSRAIEEFYGTSLPPAELAERYFTVGDAGDVVLKGQGLTVAADYPDLRPRRRDHPLPFVLGALGLLWMLPTGIFLISCRTNHTRRVRLISTWALLGTLMAMHIALFVGPIIIRVQPDRLEVAIASWLRELPSALSGGVAVLWSAAIAIVVACTWFAVRRFYAMEAESADTGACLMASSDEGRS